MFLLKENNCLKNSLNRSTLCSLPKVIQSKSTIKNLLSTLIIKMKKEPNKLVYYQSLRSYWYKNTYNPISNNIQILMEYLIIFLLWAKCNMKLLLSAIKYIRNKILASLLMGKSHISKYIMMLI